MLWLWLLVGNILYMAGIINMYHSGFFNQFSMGGETSKLTRQLFLGNFATSANTERHTYVWNKPAGCQFIRIFVISCGSGGGGGGGAAVATAMGGGGGGAGGLVMTYIYKAVDVPNILYVIPASGRAGGAGSATTTGNTGEAYSVTYHTTEIKTTASQASNFYSQFTPAAGTGGTSAAGGTAGSSTGNNNQALFPINSAIFNGVGIATAGGGAGGNTAPTAGANSVVSANLFPTIGGGGGGGATAVSASNGGSSIQHTTTARSYMYPASLTTAAGTGGASPTAGADGYFFWSDINGYWGTSFPVGSGGGGGGGGLLVNGGKGGDGAPGCGGGGGGGSSQGTGGNGGAGGPGYVIIECW